MTTPDWAELTRFAIALAGASAKAILPHFRQNIAVDVKDGPVWDPVTEGDRAGELFRRGDAYGIPGRQVDGMNVLSVREAAIEALDHARSGKGPMVLEVRTYRFRGHSMSDPAKYRTKEEVERMRQQSDPVENLRKMILDGGHADEDALKAIDREVKAVVSEAAEFAQQSPEPDPSELWTDVLVDA
jgi:pyruvate dehydrogenase E1 component alpha subunit